MKKIEGTSLVWLMASIKKKPKTPKASILPNGETLKTLSPRLGTSQRCPSSLLFDIIWKAQASGIRKEIKIKRWKEVKHNCKWHNYLCKKSAYIIKTYQWIYIYNIYKTHNIFKVLFFLFKVLFLSIEANKREIKF